MVKYILVVILISSATGCGIAARVGARNDMETSKKAYTKCLERESDVSRCERYKRAFEANIKAYRVIKTPDSKGTSSTIILEQE